MAIDTTTELVRAYYDSWKDGPGHFDEARLRDILAPDLVFEGPLAGHRVGAEGFLTGVADFARRIQSFTLLHQVHSGNQAAWMYDCTLAGGTTPLRFAEFLRIEHDRIQEITLLYDKQAFLKPSLNQS